MAPYDRGPSISRREIWAFLWVMRISLKTMEGLLSEKINVQNNKTVYQLLQ